MPDPAAGGAPPPRDDSLKVLRSPVWPVGAGGEMRRMEAMTLGCCRSGSSLNRSVGRPHRGGSAQV